MLNEKRVKHMIHMAMFEKNESRDYYSMLNTTKKDYISFRDMIGTITGTLFYLLFAGGVVAVVYTFFLASLNRTIVILAIVAGLIGYIVFLYVYKGIVHGHAVRRYSRAKRKINRVKKDWEILEQLYEEEASRKTPQALKKPGEKAEVAENG